MLYYIFFEILLVHLATEVSGGTDCTLSNDGQLAITPTDGSEADGSYKDGLSYVVTCSVANFQFVNGVRRVEGVDLSKINKGQGVTIACSNGQLSPNIFVDVNSDARVLYCFEGCAPFDEALYDVSYPLSIITREENSTPIIYNNFMSVTLACTSGYTRPVGGVGKSSVLCEKNSDSKVVTWSTDNVINCIAGCKDITRSVANGGTTDKASTTAGAAPFSTGDKISFFCDAGYRIVGFSTLTCTGANVWNEKIPECIFVT